MDARLKLFFEGLIRSNRHQEPGTTIKKSFTSKHGYKHSQYEQNIELYNMINSSWEISPEQTLQLIMHARDCRGGKGEKFVSLDAMYYLRKTRPQTYLLNMQLFIQVGCFKDLIKIANWVIRDNQCSLSDHSKYPIELYYYAEILKVDYAKVIEFEEEKGLINEDGSSNVKQMKNKIQHPKVTLAAKWAPSENKHFDKEYQILCNIMFGEKDKEKNKKYRQLVNRIRKYNTIIETLMCSNLWDQIDFETVPSRAHLLNKKVFAKHCSLYNDYLEHVSIKDKIIHTKLNHPHEILKYYYENRTNQPDATVEVMWKDMIDKIKQDDCGKFFKDSIAVSDVSGSMLSSNRGLAMQNSIALGLFIAQLSGHNKIITFDTTPSMIDISEEQTIFSKYQHIRNSPWGGCTNILATMRLIIDEFTDENRPKYLFIFSDMQFNCIDSNIDSNNIWEQITMMFHERNIQVPVIIFWNLNGSFSFDPIQKDEHGVFLLSGFSTNILKQLMKNDLNIKTSLDIMEDCISKYQVMIHEDEKVFTTQ